MESQSAGVPITLYSVVITVIEMDKESVGVHRREGAEAKKAIVGSAGNIWTGF